MPRRYYSSRTKPGSLNVDALYQKLLNLYFMFRDKDYFKGKANITEHELPSAIKYEAALALNFQPFPIVDWHSHEITEDHVFKPGSLEALSTESGYNYYDYGSYDDAEGQNEFRSVANSFLADYRSGFELTKEGLVLAIGTAGVQHILNAEIIPYDEANVDGKVRNAIVKWRNRHFSLSEQRDAIRELADVFEWLKKTKDLGAVLKREDESAIFNIANNFAIRHHAPGQKTNYDRQIWYSWIFHFYLATYHATIRLLIKKEKGSDPSTKKPLPMG